MTLPSAKEASQTAGPALPSNFARYAILGRWIAIIARHETIVTSDALALAVALAERIGDGWDRWHKFEVGKLSKAIRCDETEIWAALKRLEECNAITCDWLGNRGARLKSPYVLLAFGQAALAAKKK